MTYRSAKRLTDFKRRRQAAGRNQRWWIQSEMLRNSRIIRTPSCSARVRRRNTLERARQTTPSDTYGLRSCHWSFAGHLSSTYGQTASCSQMQVLHVTTTDRTAQAHQGMDRYSHRQAGRHRHSSSNRSNNKHPGAKVRHRSHRLPKVSPVQAHPALPPPVL